MSAYSEDLPAQALCYMEGHYWIGGSCSRCGEQLRCGACGRYVDIDKLDAHLDGECPVVSAQAGSSS